ncbi:MAG: hypothetical protein M1817_006750 [Caeruleum heppii]|nr:MAG: hypothetical protein M1817_006750 [Caeruleum heppii]
MFLLPPIPTACTQTHTSRRYAHIHSSSSSSTARLPPWPSLPGNPPPIPTPYQIFSQRKGTPYSKRRFYELVKLYHPDTACNVSTGGLHDAVRLDRYRLVVKANDILSDPVKRAAYDRYGAGWGGAPEVADGAWGYHRPPSSSDSGPYAHPHGDTSYAGSGPFANGWSSSFSSSSSHSDPFRNATWEDWERYHTSTSTTPPTPPPIPHSLFISLLILLATLGGLTQASHVSRKTMELLDQRNRVHNLSSRELIHRRRETVDEGTDRELRIVSFVREREPGGTEEEEEGRERGWRRLVPLGEVCRSGGVAGWGVAVEGEGEVGETTEEED